MAVNVTKLTARSHLWSQLILFLLPVVGAFFLPWSCLSFQCSVCAPPAMKAALTTWALGHLSALICTLHASHSLGSKHWALFCYESHLSSQILRDLKARSYCLWLCIYRALLNRPLWRRRRPLNGLGGWRQQAEAKWRKKGGGEGRGGEMENVERGLRGYRRVEREGGSYENCVAPNSHIEVLTFRMGLYSETGSLKR